MNISESKMKMVIENYFRTECDLNTSIHDAFEKGFRIGVKKANHKERIGKWVKEYNLNFSPFDYSSEYIYTCSECGFDTTRKYNYCPECGSKNKTDQEDIQQDE